MLNANSVTVQACPFNGKTCRNGKREDFEINPQTSERFVCAKWICLKGKNPQTEEVFDNWMCNESAIPMLLVENAQMTRHSAASTDKVATEVRNHHVSFLDVIRAKSAPRLLDAEPVKSVEHKNGSPGE